MKVAIIAADGVEQVELVEPREAVENAGAEVEPLSIEEGEIQAMDHDIDKADTFTVDGQAHRGVRRGRARRRARRRDRYLKR